MSRRIRTARELISHLEDGLRQLGVNDAPIIMWDPEQAGDLYDHSVDGRTDAGNRGFYRDDEGNDVSIHLGIYNQCTSEVVK